MTCTSPGRRANVAGEKTVRVKLMKVQSIVVEVAVPEDASDLDAEDAATDLFYRGDVGFSGVSPSLMTVILRDGQ